MAKGKTGRLDTSPVRGKVDGKVIAAVAAALGMHLQHEKLRFRILNIAPVQSSDLNFWGVTGRIDNMRRELRSRW